MTDDKASVVKAGAAWGGVSISKALAMVGIATWSDFAAACAAVYSLILIFDWLRKRWIGWRKS